MADYDFSTLNDKEFEILCVDLLSTLHNHRFERFKAGKDGGVDGRYFNSNGKEIILQCKHWQATPLERLIAHLQKNEKPKITTINPIRYILAVSHSISRTDKTKIRQVLSPYVLQDDDVLGREDLNDLLAKDSKVELRHYKLWIRSTSVLNYLLNKAIRDRSAYALEEILREAKLYVPTQLHDIAIDKLEQLGTIIVTGAPGIGKSTLANHMILHYVKKGFELCQIAEDLHEAERIYEEGADQIFYFDDFLGRNYLEALSGHEGSHIVQFIKRISYDKKKRFVLTSRTTILNQGKALIDIFSQNNVERNELEVKIESLREIDKAKILYNHIWHSSLDASYIDELYVKKRYRTIISHRNFNPRLIRFITDSNSVLDKPSSEYWSYTTQLLENPAKVWQHPFEAQLDDFGRSIILLVTLHQRSISETDLAEAYARFVARPESSGLSGRRDFLLTLRHLVGSLLNRTTSATATLNTASIDLFNPSIGDYVLNRYSSDLPSLRAAFSSLRNEASISTLTGFVSSNLLEKSNALSIALDILQGAHSSFYIGYSSTHIAEASAFAIRNDANFSRHHELMRSIGEFLLNSLPPLTCIAAAGVLEHAFRTHRHDEILLEKWIQAAYENNAYPQEIQSLMLLAEILPATVRIRLDLLREEAAVAYLSQNARDEFDATEVFSDADWNDLDPARETIEMMARSRLKELDIDPDDEMIRSIIDAYDIDSQAERYFTNTEPDDDWRSYPSESPIDDIDDLFDRT